MGKIYVGNVGVRIELDIGQAVAEATVTKIKYVKPDGTTGLWDASKGTEADVNKIYYITGAEDLDQAGVWTFYSYVELNDFVGYGEASEMTVEDAVLVALVAGTNTWVEMEDANTYFFTRVGSSLWNESNALEKMQALISAYNQLTGCGLFDFPSEVSGNMLNAQCEMALFLLRHQEDIDARKGLQAQGVVSAGIVQETYDKDMIGEVPIPPIVKSMLGSYVSSSPIHIVNLERDEGEDAL